MNDKETILWHLKQDLSTNKNRLFMLEKGDIGNDTNIVFLTTKYESQNKYIQTLVHFIEEEM